MAIPIPQSKPPLAPLPALAYTHAPHARIRVILPLLPPIPGVKKEKRHNPPLVQKMGKSFTLAQMITAPAPKAMALTAQLAPMTPEKQSKQSPSPPADTSGITARKLRLPLAAQQA